MYACDFISYVCVCKCDSRANTIVGSTNVRNLHAVKAAQNQNYGICLCVARRMRKSYSSDPERYERKARSKKTDSPYTRGRAPQPY